MKLEISNPKRQALLLLIGFLTAHPAFAQRLDLSKNSDFSTADVTFTFNETLYARVTAAQIDYNDLDKNEYRLKSNNYGDEVQGAFTNNLNSTYTVAIPLSSLNQAENNWEFRAEIKDDDGNEFKTTVNLTILNNPPPVIIELEDEIEALSTNSLKVSGKTVFVDTVTVVTEFGRPLQFVDLQRDWKVHVRAELRADNFLWALAIEVLDRASTNTVTARGRMANLQDSVMIVNNINFRVTQPTQLQDKNGALIALTAFRVGMLVESRGAMQANDKILANLVKIEDDNFINKEIEFTGTVNAKFSRPPVPDSIRINGDLFEVDGQTELRGFKDEPVLLTDLRPGETVQIKALTRQNRLASALRIKRRLIISGDVEVKGRIDRLQDSSLVIGGVEFFRSSTTIILDDENLFIPYSALRLGLIVEVAANRQNNGRLLATIIKVEDAVNDEVELTGLVNALTDTSIIVAGFIFRVDAATAVVDQNRAAIKFSDLRPNLLVEIRGDRRFDGSLLATEIHLEDLLSFNEIELRSAITQIAGSVVRVTDIDFVVGGATTILDSLGRPASLAQLTVGMIVEIHAKFSSGAWQASRIKIEDEIDNTVVVIGAIDSVADNSLRILGRSVRVTQRTILRGLGNEAISLSNLRVNDIVEVLAQQLPDSSLTALRVKRENRNAREIEARGKIALRRAASIVIGSVTLAVDAATTIFDAGNQPIAPAALRNGQVAVVNGTRQINGVFVANRIQLQNQRVLAGVVNGTQAGVVIIAGISHASQAQSFFVDEQNLPISASEVFTQQQVRVIANAANDRWEILHLQILYRLPPTTVVGESPGSLLPKNFVLYQNFPNPFSNGASSRIAFAARSFTLIRFALPRSEEIFLTIYNQLGQKIRTINTGRLPAGFYERAWDGRNEAGAKVASGIYFYQLRAGEHIATRRMIVIR